LEEEVIVEMLHRAFIELYQKISRIERGKASVSERRSIHPIKEQRKHRISHCQDH